MKKYNIFIVIMIFCLVYIPPIINLNILHFIGAFSWLYLISKRTEISRLFNKKLFTIYSLFVIPWIYLLFVTLFNDNAITNSFDFLYWLIDVLPACLMLCTYFYNKSYDIYDLLNILLIVGLLQSVSAILAFLMPSVQQFFVNRLIDYGYTDTYMILSEYRMYGFASNLTFSTPIVQSILSIISVYLSINKKWTYIFFGPLLFFSAIINARISLIIIIIGIMAIIFGYKKFNSVSFIRIIIISCMVLLSINLLVPFVEKNSSSTFKWILEGYNEIVGLFSDNQNMGSYFSYLFETRRYSLPEGLNLFFGVGQRIMTLTKYNVRSDIGYINDIWLGGIFYSIFIYIIFASFLINLLNSKNSDNYIKRFLFILFVGAFTVCNIKGYIFSMNNFTNFFFIIYSFLALLKIDNDNNYQSIKKTEKVY